MQTIKTGVVIALLIAVCYGAFIALNAPEADIPPSIQDWVGTTDLDNLQVDVDLGFDVGMPTSASPDTLSGGFDLPNSFEASNAGSQVTTPTLPVADVSLPQAGEVFADGSLPQFPSTTELPQTIPNPDSLAGSLSVDINLPQTDLEGPAVPFNADNVSPSKESYVSVELPNAAGLPDAGVSTDAAGNPLSKGDLKDASQPFPSSNLPVLDNTSSPASSASGTPTQSPMPVLPYAIAREQALMKADAGDLTEALKMLSPFYNSPEIDFKEHEDLLDILDALSRHAIYSSSYMLEPAYTVSATDTLASIAEKHKITPELLSAINGLEVNRTLTPGTTLKVINGPFRAQVQIRRSQLAVFLGNLYAGRFDIEIGSDPTPTPGVYEVDDRRRDRTYYQTGGAVIQANEAKNPYGGFWISLGGNLSIHGSPSVDVPELKNAGCISLAPIDAQHVYHMLIKHSQVQIVP